MKKEQFSPFDCVCKMFFLLVFSGILIVVLFSFWGEGGGGEIFVQSECHRCTDYISENVFIGNGSCVLICTFFGFIFEECVGSCCLFVGGVGLLLILLLCGVCVCAHVCVYWRGTILLNTT